MRSTSIIGILVFICILLLHPLINFGQTDSSSGKIVKKIGRGKIMTKDRVKYSGRNLVFDSEFLTFENVKTGRIVTLSLDDVYYATKTGNYALEGALAGGATALLSCLYALVEVEADPLRVPKENAGELVLGITVAGTAIGALVGLAMPKEKTIYQKGRLQLSVLYPSFVQSTNREICISFLSIQVLF